MKNKISKSKINGSYTIPAGYHNGSGKVTANSLASQTSATAGASVIVKGYTAYVNGSRITGNLVMHETHTAWATCTGSVYVNILSLLPSNTQLIVLFCRTRQFMQSGGYYVYDDLSIISGAYNQNYINTATNLILMNNNRGYLNGGMQTTFTSTWSNQANCIMSALNYIAVNQCMPIAKTQLSNVQVAQRFSNSGSMVVTSSDYRYQLFYWVDD